MDTDQILIFLDDKLYRIDGYSVKEIWLEEIRIKLGSDEYIPTELYIPIDKKRLIELFSDLFAMLAQ